MTSERITDFTICLQISLLRNDKHKKKKKKKTEYSEFNTELITYLRNVEKYNL